MFGTGLCRLFFYRAYMYSKSKSQKSGNLSNFARKTPDFWEQEPSGTQWFIQKKELTCIAFLLFLKFFLGGRGGGRGRELFLWTRAKRRSAALGIHYISQAWTPVRVNDLWNWVRLITILSGLPPYSVNQSWP